MQIDGLEALFALAEEGTVARAATRLRLSASAVSRRLSALEASLGRDLVEPDGRNVRLTAEGHRLLRDARPAVSALREALEQDPAVNAGTVAVGVSESILASWGAPLLAKVQKQVKGLTLELHAHRSPVVSDRVAGGEVLLGLVAGDAPRAADLDSDTLPEEEMVIVPSRGRRSALRGRARIEVVTIEPRSGTWPALKPRLERLRRRAGYRLDVVSMLESFATVVQVARAGLGHGLAPRGIARALGVPTRGMVRLPEPGLARPVHLVGRRAALGRPLVAALRAAILEEVVRGRRRR
ncbi:MAG: LysR family transcriptional regulator [Planctomycetota bacterium]|jgi:DNA-binding transcriptional LysR family regulator